MFAATLATLLVGAPAPVPAATPQGPPATQVRVPTLEDLPRYPASLPMHTCRPFVDAKGQPIDHVLAASGSADVDGDGQRDLWFLAGAGPQRGRISLLMARTSSLGRFRPWHISPAGSFVDAATYRSTTSSVHRLVAADPNSTQPTLLSWNPKSLMVDPRIGSLGGGGSGWTMGLGAYEIEARDDAGDGHDDITVLQRLANGHTVIKKLCMGTGKFSFLWPEQTVQATAPAALHSLRMFDFDGDRRSDVVAVVKGLGVLVARDNGKGAFEAAAFWPIPNGVRDLAVGDVQGDGRDDLAICLDFGVLVMLSLRNGFSPRAMYSPQHAQPLASARIVDLYGAGTSQVLGFPASGRGYLVYGTQDVVKGNFNPLVVVGPPALTGPGLRPGTSDSNVIVADVDNDGDLDVLLRDPVRTGFLTLKNPSTSLAPTVVQTRFLAPLPSSEVSKGALQQLTVAVPPELVAHGVTTLEVAFFTVDPDSKDPKDPDYIYWGRVLSPIQVGQIGPHTATLTVFAWTDQQLWDAQVRALKKRRALAQSEAPLVHPSEEPEAIRIGPGSFFSAHGYRASGARTESSSGEDGDKDKPKKGKSTLGPRWVLRADPPKPTADTDLLPWE